MGTWTMYTSGADVTLLQMILNGVAMVCAQTDFVWGFALLASSWLLVQTVTAGTMATAGGNAGSTLSTGSLGALLPLVLAVLLTAPAAQCTVQVESVLNGNMTQVAHVPFVIAVIPVAGSQMGVNTNAVVTTAFGSVNPSYNYISATGNGFLDPMKRLLGARAAMKRLSGIDSEIHTVIAACITKDGGANFADVQRRVLNAANSGAPVAETIPINGVQGSGIGALLYQAAQNLNATVPELIGPNSQAILSCPDAVAQVQDDIDAALNSSEFARVTQGAVNGMDQPNPAASYTIDQMSQEYTALRKFNSVTGTLPGGQAQANAEMINILFDEMVSSSLNCLQATGPELSGCQAAMVQASEIERANIQAAANEVPMLKYAGSFGAYLLALIIGLGPIIVMFMMFAGKSVKSCLVTLVHIMVWPILVMNVGAEIVNAMISMQFSNFMATITQGGYLSHAITATAYKELSLQVGTGSHIMASLPILMSMIFSLGATSALVSVASESAPKGKEVGENAAPSPSAAAPLVRNTAPVTATQGASWVSNKAAGALDALSMQQTVGSMSREYSRARGESETRTKTISEGQTVARNFEKGTQTGDYSSLGWTHSEGESVRKAVEQSQRDSHRDSVSKDASAMKQNSNNSSAGISGSASASLGTSGAGFNLGAGVDGKTQTRSLDTKSVTHQGSRADSAETAKALSTVLSGEVGQRIERAHRTESGSTARKTQSVMRNYQNLLSRADSQTDSKTEMQRAGSSLVGAFNKIGAPEVAQAWSSNPTFARQQLDAGRRRDMDTSTSKYRDIAETEMKSQSTDTVDQNPGARAAAVRLRAAVLQGADTSASDAERFGAFQFLAESGAAMTHMNVGAVDQRDGQLQGQAIAEPVDRTGIDVRGLTGEGKNASASGKNVRSKGASTSMNGRRPQDALMPAKSLQFDGEAGRATTAKLDEMFADADDSGLGEKGSGTVARTAANVADNAVDLARPAGSRSRVRFGTNPPEPAPAPPPRPLTAEEKEAARLEAIQPFLAP